MCKNGPNIFYINITNPYGPFLLNNEFGQNLSKPITCQNLPAEMNVHCGTAMNSEHE